MNERIERQRNIRNLTGERVRTDIEALKSKVRSGQATPEEKTKLKGLEKRAAKILKGVETKLDR
jgi:hypothetical protein